MYPIVPFTVYASRLAHCSDMLAITPRRAKRGTSVASIASRWVMVWRRSRAPFCSSAAWKSSSASRVARSPIAWTWICHPALSSSTNPCLASEQDGTGPVAVPARQRDGGRKRRHEERDGRKAQQHCGSSSARAVHRPHDVISNRLHSAFDVVYLLGRTLC